MSGGSFNYLCYKTPEELFNCVSDIEDMRDIALKLNYEDIALDLTRLVEYIKSAKIRVSVLSGQLNKVMHSLEWYDSADIGKETLDKEIEKYRRSKDDR